MNQLVALKKITKIVADSGDINEINLYKPEDATTNPSLILKSIHIPEYKELIHNAVIYGKKNSHIHQEQIIHASDKVLINIGSKILQHISGRVSSEIDARLSFNTDLCILKAKKIIDMYEDVGISRSRILIKLASTWECIRAAQELEKQNIQCNLTLLFSFAQAQACAEAGVFLISPFVGRIYDWYVEKKLIQTYNVNQDPGVKSVKKIYMYYKKYNYNTIIMGASFRNIDQILALSGCDYLTISPVLLKELQKNTGVVKRNLIPPSEICIPSNILSESEFRWNHNQDQMAVEKLSDGIRQFSRDQEELENLLNSIF